MNLADFRRTRFAIQTHVRRTPLVSSTLPGLYLKLENLQWTRSFKVRGAFAAVAALASRGDSRRILAVSAGNHGQAIARAAAHFGRHCTIVVPESAPRVKIDAIRRYGVNLMVEGANYDAAERIALEVGRDQIQFAFVSGYNHPDVVLGQGSLSFEILEQLPAVKTVLVAVGGGGLIGGMAAVMKLLRPEVRVVGVQAEVSAAVYQSLRAGRMVTVPDAPSIADGIQGNIDLETITFPMIQNYVDDVVVVSEAEIRDSMASLLLEEKTLVEGSGAVTYAAFKAGKTGPPDQTVALVSGGNVDPGEVVSFVSSYRRWE